ncbi:MAG TPA: MBL fold metallo-hydrolase [Rhodocyclaceae bacterium]|nr:MBL fold metallo-hydrolase [Rhodocyclaceae bacterium]
MDAIEYPYGRLPEAGGSEEIVPGVRWVRMPLPFALDHINLWLLADGDTWTAVDTGIAMETLQDSWRKLLPGHPLSRIIVTHFHPDHLGLAAWLVERTGATLWISQGEYTTSQMIRHQIASYSIPAMLQFFQGHGLDTARLEALAVRGNSYGKGVPAVPTTYRRLFDGEDIVIGGRAWRTMVGHGHAPEHMSLYCAELGILISGDMLLPRISTNISAVASNPDGDPLRLFLDSLQRLKALPADTLVFPSHGRPFRGLHVRIAELEAHHEARCAELVAACEAPKTAADLIPVIFQRELGDAHQTMFAMGETIAHLKYLEHAQRLRCATENGISRYAVPN